MSTNDETSIIEDIKGTYRNIAVTIGAIAVFTLIICTFTLGSLADSNHSYFIWFQSGWAALMTLVLIGLKRVSFFLTRVWLGGRKRYKATLGSLSVADMS